MVSVLHGWHDATLDGWSVAKKVAWISQAGSDRAKGFEGPVLASIDLLGWGLTLTDETVLDNLIIEGSGPSMVRSSPAITIRPASGTPRVRMVNCIIRDWYSAEIFYGYLGAIVNDGGALWLVDTTVCDSSGLDSSFMGTQQCVLENVSGTFQLQNSVLWDAASSAT